MPQDPLYGKYGDSLEPTRKPTETDVAFFAGFFDGEGSCTPHKQHRALSVKISQKDPELLYRLRDLWGGSVRFWAVKNEKGSWIFEGYESYKNPIYVWTVTGDRARGFLRQIYPLVSNRRKVQIDRIDLTPVGWKLRKSPRMSPERQAAREKMDDRERLLESKAHHRAENLEHCRAKDREYQQKKFGWKPRKGVGANDAQPTLLVN